MLSDAQYRQIQTIHYPGSWAPPKPPRPVVAQARSLDRPIGAMVAFLAAVAEPRRLRLVTRNISDFDRSQFASSIPWTRNDDLGHRLQCGVTGADG